MDRKSSVEIWKDIEGYEGLFQVSNLGRVKSVKFGKEKIKKNDKNEDGYLRVNLWKEGKQKIFRVHRLVAKAFISNPNNLPEVNHIDEDKSNNRIENLEWCSREYNINYGCRNEKVAKSKFIPILQFTKDGEFVRRWDGIRQVGRELGIKPCNITSCLKGQRKTAGKYKWGYADDYERIPFNVFDLELYRKKVA